MDPTDPIEDVEAQIANVGRAFSPSSPITRRDLFAGRQDQMWRLQDVATQRGQHALIYGERGVGKTSLAQVSMSIAQNTGAVCAYYTCSSDDDFESIWRKLLREITFVVETQGPGFASLAVQEIKSVESLLPADPSPDDVRRVLAHLTQVGEAIVYVDEFDRPTDPTCRRLFADLVKILSDRGVQATLVLVGVASTVSDLVGEHESVGRSLIQVQMPVMAIDELEEIVRSGMTKAEMFADDRFIHDVAAISQGLPHYTHLIAQHGARFAVERHARRTVTGADFPHAIGLAVNDVSQSIREAYHRATHSNRETLYREVLLACAKARKNDLGEFGSADVRGPLCQITNRTYDIPAFSAHLNSFSDDNGPRGGVLRKLGSQARFRYRFIDPLMAPYVLMRGVTDGAHPSLI